MSPLRVRGLHTVPPFKSKCRRGVGYFGANTASGFALHCGQGPKSPCRTMQSSPFLSRPKTLHPRGVQMSPPPFYSNRPFGRPEAVVPCPAARPAPRFAPNLRRQASLLLRSWTKESTPFATKDRLPCLTPHSPPGPSGGRMRCGTLPDAVLQRSFVLRSRPAWREAKAFFRFKAKMRAQP